MISLIDEDQDPGLWKEEGVIVEEVPVIAMIVIEVMDIEEVVHVLGIEEKEAVRVHHQGGHEVLQGKW
uniref:Uncharacterized protein n=1 Tax=Acrobeloides nanus TaxID=290746 RepID=A0A914CPG9_9BILA